MSQHAKEALSMRDVLSIRNFRFLWFGQMVSDFGDALTQLTLVLFVNRVTDGDTAAIAYLLIAFGIPMAVVGPIAGVFVDRWDRKRIMIWSDILRGLLSLAFIVAAWQRNLWLVYGIAFLLSIVGTFFTPARGAVIPNIVPENGLLTANSLAQTSFVIIRVLGIAAAGFIVGQFAVFWPIFALDALTFFVSVLFIIQVAVPAREPTAATESTPLRATVAAVLADLRVGITTIAESRILIGALVGITITMLGLGAVGVLMAPLLVNEMGLSETWFGALELAQTVGMVLSGVAVAGLAARFRPTTLITGGLVGLGIGVTLLSTVGAVWHFFPLMFLIGLMVTPINSSLATLMQTEVADELRGRIGSSLNALMQVSSMVSLFAAGTVAAWIGTRSVFALGGAITVVAGVAAALIFRGQVVQSVPVPDVQREAAVEG